MKITNNSGLPEPIVKAIENDPYSNSGTLSVTTLLRPPMAVYLGRKHGEELVEDARDRVYSLMGQAGHVVVERAAKFMDPKKWVSERRFYSELFGEKLSGAADLVEIETGTVYDLKYTSRWAVKDALQNGKNDWRLQLSLLALLALDGRFIKDFFEPVYDEDDDLIGVQLVRTEIRTGKPIKAIRGKIIAVIRDHSVRDAQRNRDLPQNHVEQLDMDIMSNDETMAWLEKRIEEHNQDPPRECTDEERWAKPGKWAVYKGSNIKAAKLEDSEYSLEAWIALNQVKLGPTYRTEERPRSYTRCESYCSVSAFCPTWQAYLRDNPTDEKE